MKIRIAFLLLVTMLVSSFGAAAAQHHDHGTPEPHHSGDHMSATPAAGMSNMSMGAFYFTVTNTGNEADRLVKIESDVAIDIEIHNVELKDGVMAMEPQHDGVEIAAGEELVMEPGSSHVMLIDINKSLLDGEGFTASLYFEHAGEVEVTVPIYMVQPDEEDFAEPVTVGDTIEISGIWARQAPKVEGNSPMASPAATPTN